MFVSTLEAVREFARAEDRGSDFGKQVEVRVRLCKCASVRLFIYMHVCLCVCLFAVVVCVFLCVVCVLVFTRAHRFPNRLCL